MVLAAEIFHLFCRLTIFIIKCGYEENPLIRASSYFLRTLSASHRVLVHSTWWILAEQRGKSPTLLGTRHAAPFLLYHQISLSRADPMTS